MPVCLHVLSPKPLNGFRLNLALEVYKEIYLANLIFGLAQHM
jgi:hypothetical protein